MQKHKRSHKKSSVPKDIPTLGLKSEYDIAMDFAAKVYQKFDKAIKAVVLFGSTAKRTQVPESDIDIVIIVDDAAIRWNQEMVVWYREELDKILRKNPYTKTIHVNTVKLTTWWEDLMKGDPVVINILRYGETLIDLGGFFTPLKAMLISGRIRPTPEAIYNCLQRAPMHLLRSKASELNAVEGLYWCMVDASHAALIAANILPPSPEHIPMELQNYFVNTGKLKVKYVGWFRELHILHKKISHGEITDLKGVEIDNWQLKTEEFLQTMTRLVKELVV